jgi:hypothetical protein
MTFLTFGMQHDAKRCATRRSAHPAKPPTTAERGGWALHAPGFTWRMMLALKAHRHNEVRPGRAESGTENKGQTKVVLTKNKPDIF